MKKILIILLSAYLLSSCYLITEPPEPRETETTIQTATFTAVDTGIPTELPAETSTPQFTATPFPFVIQSGTPAYIENYAHLLKGCDWLGIAGQVFDADGKPLINKVVMVTGKIEEKVVEIVGVTGVPEADIYGPGGFEIQIADQVFASEKVLAIQVFDLDGIPISGSIPFDTLADCEKNLIIINFQSTE